MKKIEELEEFRKTNDNEFVELGKRLDGVKEKLKRANNELVAREQ